MALTATATERVCRDLSDCLTCRRNASSGPLLPGKYPPACGEVLPERDKTARVIEFYGNEAHRPAVVYARTRKDAESLSYELGRAGFAAKSYHAGMPPETRAGVQDDFLKGTADVLVATIAFGMGIDKPDVRSVVHYHPPSSLEAYVQESGRAGRDGLPSASLVMLSSGTAWQWKTVCGLPYRTDPGEGAAFLSGGQGEHIISPV